MQEDVFVLDIGTRSVMALLAGLEKEELVVRHMLYKEHKSRAMLDGQIHHVDQVTEIINELVQEMKKVSGQEITKAAVAAAGRSLVTVKGKTRMKYHASTVISREELMSLVLQAVLDAQLSLPKRSSEQLPLSQKDYCVGYSIIEERLDGIKLGTIAGQKGQEAEVEVVATFLPRIVVDSIQSAVQQAGLELCSITLEPIAVANLVLSPAMRRLNLVLVDIGAGTADIAVCGGESVSAFGMVPMAGDEITEAVSDHYLLDFIKAEEAKRQIGIHEVIKTIDVLGLEHDIPKIEIEAVIKPAVEELAAAIAKEILTLNNKPPQAVLLVGGGSLTPGLPQTLADMLEIPDSRIVVQQAENLQQIKNLSPEHTGPAFITALGIAYTYMKYPTMGFITLEINKKKVKLLQLAQNTVAEALITGGYNLKDIYGRPGLALTCEINGSLFTIPGKPGKPGRITLNGKEATFGDLVRDGDNIEFEPGTTGENGEGIFRDVIKDAVGYCTVNGIGIELTPVVMAGGKNIPLDSAIEDGIKVEIRTNETIEDVLATAGLIKKNETININHKPIKLLELATIKRNGEKAGPEEMVAPGDNIHYEKQDLKVGDLLPDDLAEIFEVYVNGKRIVLRSNQIWVNGEEADFSTPIKSGDSIEYVLGKQGYRPILIDIFKEIDFSAQPPPGKSKLHLLVNNEEKEYTHPLNKGDRIKISWV